MLTRALSSRYLMLILVLIVPFITIFGLVGAVQFHELSMNNLGQVYEINQDSGGGLRISDYLAGEVWFVDPGGASYSVFSNLPGATDARVDEQDNLWWLNFDDNRLGYLPKGQSEAQVWPLGGLATSSGLVHDSVGNVWISHINAPKVQRFDLTTTQLCTYTFPAAFSGYTSWYVTAEESGSLWLAGANASSLGRVFRLDPAIDIMTGYGPFDFGSNPIGLSLDGNGGIWWADQGLGEIAHLDPTTSLVTHYDVPSVTSLGSVKTDKDILKGGRKLAQQATLNGQPTLIEAQDDRIWYTDFANGHLGKLAPQVALNTTEVVANLNQTVIPDCQILGPGLAQQVVKSESMPAAWLSATVTTLIDSEGWAIYELPESSAPWGISVNEGQAWIAQQQRQTLGRFGYPACYYLILSSSGLGSDLVATPDRSPGCSAGQFLPGQAISLTVSADAGYAVAGWSGTDNDQSAAASNTLTMPAADHWASVYYGKCFNLSLTHTGNGADPMIDPGNYPGCESSMFVQGATINLMAVPANDWVVTGWSGTDDDSSRSTTNTATMPNGDHIVSVIYGEVQEVFLPHVLR